MSAARRGAAIHLLTLASSGVKCPREADGRNTVGRGGDLKRGGNPLEGAGTLERGGDALEGVGTLERGGDGARERAPSMEGLERLLGLAGRSSRVSAFGPRRFMSDLRS